MGANFLENNFVTSVKILTVHILSQQRPFLEMFLTIILTHINTYIDT